MLELLKLVMNDYTFRVVALGTVILGLASGILSSFVTLNKQSLIGDALSHAALPGIVLVFMIIKIKNLELLLLGALIFGLLAIALINIIRKYSKVKFDSALGLVLSSFFGFGLVLMTILQKQPDSSQAGLDSFIFGQASTMLVKDIYIMLGASFLVILLIILFWKELKLFVFNAEFAQALGFNVKYINILFSSLIVITVIMGLETVGVILISSLLVAPGVAARQWTNKLSIMVILSGLFGAISGLIGTMVSAISPKVATGAVIVVILSIFAFVSILFGKERGIVWRQIKKRYNNQRIKYYQILRDLKGDSNIILEEKIINKLIHRNYIIIKDDKPTLTDNAKELITFYEGRLKYES